MKRAFIQIVICSALFCFASNSPAQELRKEGRNYVAELEKKFDVKSGGELRIYDVRGDVFITTWGNAQVLVRESSRMDVYTEQEAKTVLKKSKSSYRQTGNRIEIGGDTYRRDWINSRFNVTVPKSFNVTVETRGGDISVDDLTGLVNLNTSGGDITLRNIDGEVEAKTSGGDIEVLNSKKRVAIRTSGGDLELENIGGPLIAKTSGGDITLNGSQDQVELHTSGGDIRIKQAGGEVQAHTSGGDIEVFQTRGSVEVHTSGGDIEIRNAGGNLEAETSGGDIEGMAINGSVRVATSGGDIELTDIKGGVQGKTAGGDIAVEITLQDFKKDHGVSLRTAGGKITLSIPGKMPATIRAEIEITDRWEHYNIFSDFPLTSVEGSGEERKGRFSRDRKYMRSEGDINGGGDLIELSTTNGDIHIKKR